jgi:hypothetical protein
MSADAVIIRLPARGPGPQVPASFVNPRTDPAWVRWGLTGFAVLVVGVLVGIPVVNIFYEALKEGVRVYWDNLVADPDTRHSIFLTATVVPIALVANIVFGIAAAWAIARFKFPGRTLLTALIDLPFSVSPVVAGLMFVLIFGLQGYLGPFLREDGYSVMPYATSLVGVFVLVVLYFVFRPANPAARRGVWRGPTWLVAPRRRRGLRLLSFLAAAIPALRAGAAGRAGRQRGPVRAQRCGSETPRRVASGREPEDHLRDAGAGAGDGVRDLPVRRARADPDHGGGRRRRRARRHQPRRQRVADVLAHHRAQHQMGPGLRDHSL